MAVASRSSEQDDQGAVLWRNTDRKRTCGIGCSLLRRKVREDDFIDFLFCSFFALCSQVHRPDSSKHSTVNQSFYKAYFFTPFGIGVILKNNC